METVRLKSPFKQETEYTEPTYFEIVKVKNGIAEVPPSQKQHIAVETLIARGYMVVEDKPKPEIVRISDKGHFKIDIEKQPDFVTVDASDKIKVEFVEESDPLIGEETEVLEQSVEMVDRMLEKKIEVSKPVIETVVVNDITEKVVFDELKEPIKKEVCENIIDRRIEDYKIDAKPVKIQEQIKTEEKILKEIEKKKELPIKPEKKSKQRYCKYVSPEGRKCKAWVKGNTGYCRHHQIVEDDDFKF